MQTCSKCGGPAMGYKCARCGEEAAEFQELHVCGAEEFEPKCTACGMAEKNCSCATVVTTGE